MILTPTHPFPQEKGGISGRMDGLLLEMITRGVIYLTQYDVGAQLIYVEMYRALNNSNSFSLPTQGTQHPLWGATHNRHRSRVHSCIQRLRTPPLPPSQVQHGPKVGVVDYQRFFFGSPTSCARFYQGEGK